VDTSVRPMSLTADDCTPIAAASVASRQNCAHPAGLAPLTSQPTVKPASSVSSARRVHMTYDGSALVRAPARPESRFRSPAARMPCAINVPTATPTI